MAYRTIDWEQVPLGEDSDNRLARRLGCSPAQVNKARRARGIPPWSGTRPCGHDWEQVPLGELPDSQIAQQLGCSRAAVSDARRRRGIPHISEISA